MTFLVPVIVLAISVSAQTPHKSGKPLVIDSSDVAKYYNIDGHIYLEKPKKKGKKLIFRDRIPLDSSELWFSSVKIVNNFILGWSGDSLYQLNEGLLSGLAPLQGDEFTSDLRQYYVVDKNQSIFIFDPKIRQFKVLVELEDRICSTSPCYGFNDTETVEEVFALSQNIFFIQTTLEKDDVVGTGFIVYYLYDRTNDKLENISERIKSNAGACQNYESSTINLISSDNRYVRMTRDKFTDDCNLDIEKSWIADGKLDFVSDALCLGTKNYRSINPPSPRGFHWESGSITYYLASRLDNGREILVLYDFNLEMEELMFDIFHNKLIVKDRLKSLDRFKRDILRNLIYAKHNYRFTSKFYNAYFNLFCFYNHEGMSKVRVEDVGRQLTEIDRQNLRLILESK